MRKKSFGMALVNLGSMRLEIAKHEFTASKRDSEKCELCQKYRANHHDERKEVAR